MRAQEREIRALEKTLNHLYAKNTAYRHSFAPVDASAPLAEQRRLLEEQGHASVTKFRAARLEQAELEEDLNHMSETQRGVHETLETTAARIGEYEATSQQLGAEVVARQLDTEQARRDMTTTLAELQIASGRRPDAPLAAELHAQARRARGRARAGTCARAIRPSALAHARGPDLRSALRDACATPPAIASCAGRRDVDARALHGRLAAQSGRRARGRRVSRVRAAAAHGPQVAPKLT